MKKDVPTHAHQHVLPSVGWGTKPIPIQSEARTPKFMKGAEAMPKNRLKDFGTMDSEKTLENLDDIKNQDVTITGVRFTEGQHGEYAIMDVTTEDGETHTVSTGAMFVLDALRGAVEKDGLPATAKFIRRARYWLVI